MSSPGYSLAVDKAVCQRPLKASCVGSNWRNETVSYKGFLNGGQKVSRHSRLRDVCESTSAKASFDVIQVLMNRQENDPRRGAKIPQCIRSFNSVEDGHRNVRHNDIGIHSHGGLDQSLPVPHVCDNFTGGLSRLATAP